MPLVKYSEYFSVFLSNGFLHMVNPGHFNDSESSFALNVECTNVFSSFKRSLIGPRKIIVNVTVLKLKSTVMQTMFIGLSLNISLLTLLTKILNFLFE